MLPVLAQLESAHAGASDFAKLVAPANGQMAKDPLANDPLADDPGAKGPAVKNQSGVAKASVFSGFLRAASSQRGALSAGAVKSADSSQPDQADPGLVKLVIPNTSVATTGYPLAIALFSNASPPGGTEFSDLIPGKLVSGFESTGSTTNGPIAPEAKGSALASVPSTNVVLAGSASPTSAVLNPVGAQPGAAVAGQSASDGESMNPTPAVAPNGNQLTTTPGISFAPIQESPGIVATEDSPDEPTVPDDPSASSAPSIPPEGTAKNSVGALKFPLFSLLPKQVKEQAPSVSPAISGVTEEPISKRPLPNAGAQPAALGSAQPEFTIGSLVTNPAISGTASEKSVGGASSGHSAASESAAGSSVVSGDQLNGTVRQGDTKPSHGGTGDPNPHASTTGPSTKNSPAELAQDDTGSPTLLQVRIADTQSLAAQPANPPASSQGDPGGLLLGQSVISANPQPSSSPTNLDTQASDQSRASQDAANLSSESSTPPGAIQVARLIESGGQSEMHIGLSTHAFGSVEVHTLLRDSQVGLMIGSDRGDLREWFASEVPGMQAFLRRQDLHLDNVSFLGSGMGSSAGEGSSPGRSFSSERALSAAWEAPPVTPDTLVSEEIGNSLIPSAGLSVHA